MTSWVLLVETKDATAYWNNEGGTGPLKYAVVFSDAEKEVIQIPASQGSVFTWLELPEQPSRKPRIPNASVQDEITATAEMITRINEVLPLERAIQAVTPADSRARDIQDARVAALEKLLTSLSKPWV